jgi:hypothetical protein
LSALVDRSAIALSLIIAVALVPGCNKKSSDRATPPSDAGSADQIPAHPRDPIAELEQLEGRMRELGMTPVRPAAEPSERSQKENVHDDALDKGAEAGEGGERAGVQTEPMPAPTATTVEERDEYENENRCTTVCALNEAICELEVQICSMAKDHGSDPIYSDACERAVDDCELSGDACDTCVE